jgi:cysteinyl-tRNA synthetase
VRELNRRLDAGQVDAETAALRGELATAGGFLGIMNVEPEAFLEAARRRGAASGGVEVREIESLIAERNAARSRRDFRRADEIRTGLRARGILLEDGPEGTTWRAEQ